MKITNHQSDCSKIKKIWETINLRVSTVPFSRPTPVMKAEKTQKMEEMNDSEINVRNNLLDRFTKALKGSIVIDNSFLQLK